MPYRPPTALDLPPPALLAGENLPMRRLRTNLLITLLMLAALRLAAQETRAPVTSQATLAARMRAFMAEIEDQPNTELAAFFPRRGDWTWVQTARNYERGGRTMYVGMWRFPGA